MLKCLGEVVADVRDYTLSQMGEPAKTIHITNLNTDKLKMLLISVFPITECLSAGCDHSQFYPSQALYTAEASFRNPASWATFTGWFLHKTMSNIHCIWTGGHT